MLGRNLSPISVATRVCLRVTFTGESSSDVSFIPTAPTPVDFPGKWKSTPPQKRAQGTLPAEGEGMKVQEHMASGPA